MKLTWMGFVMAVGVAVAGAGPVRAETPDLGLDLSKAQRIDDSNLGGMRGKFASAGGQVVFFGLTLESSIQAKDGTTETAGVSLGVNFKNGTPRTVTTQTLTSQQQGSGITTPPSNGLTITLPLNNLTGGLKQTVQITGQDNQAANTANINLSSSAIGGGLPSFPASTPCDGCSASLTKKGIDIAIDMPGTGSSDQQIGNGSILQAINLDTSGASASNVLTLQMQTLPTGAAANLQGLSAVLQSVPVQFH